MVLLSLVLWVVALVHAAIPLPWGFVLLRLLLLAMLIFWVLITLRSSTQILLISPLVVLATIALLAYSYLPALYGAVPVALSFGEPINKYVQGYPEGLGERLVLQFVAFCLLLTTLVQRLGPGRDPANGGKPNLSRGHEYSWACCGSKSLPEAPHYELVTLLAEPVVMGGFAGLVAAQAFLGIGLVLVAAIMMRGGPLALIVIVALLPWLIHFQQSFALYFANAVKMFIYMSPAWAALWWATRRQWTVKHDPVTKG